MKVETAYMETSNGVNPDLGQICDGLIYRAWRHIVRHVLLQLSVQVARACLGSRQLQYQPNGQRNFANTFNRTLKTIGRPAP